MDLAKKDKKCAVFCCKGLGDGLIALTLSNNLRKNGYQVETFHPFLKGLQSWFPDLPIHSFPEEDQLSSFLENYDRFFIVYEKSPWMQVILSECLSRFRSQTMVVNPIATPNRDYPFWEEAQFDGTKTFVDNLFHFSRDILHLEKVTYDNGIFPPSSLQLARYPKRVVIHPTSSRVGKNWFPEKYIHLANELKQQGFEPLFLLTEEEKRSWPTSDIEAPCWNTLTELATYVYESGLMIGNDSGIGHLASCLGLPTLILCRSRMAANFWRPGWSKGFVLTPPLWIPNIKGLRWRDKHWQKWISVEKALSYSKLLINNPPVDETIA